MSTPFQRIVPVSACTLLLGGCANEKPTGTTSDRGDAFVAAVDVTYSTQGVRQTYLPDLVAVTDRAAAARAPFYADAFDGNPAAHIRWRVQGDFARRPPAVYDGNESLTQQYLAARARELRPQLRELLATRPTRSGSPLGELLQSISGLCAQQRTAGRHCRAYVFTDGVFIGDGFDARRPVTQRALQQFVDRWATRLSGLRGAEVSFVGVGYGTTVPPRALETSRRGAQALIAAAGAEMKDWNVRLAPEDGAA